jgi:hypothetical protein
MSDITTGEEIKQVVREAYRGIARRYVGDGVAAPAQASCCGPSQAVADESVAGESVQAACCGPSGATVRDVAQASCCGPSEEAAG